MDKDIKKMKKMVDFMRKQGVLTLKTQEMELQLSPLAVFPDEHKKDQIEEAQQTQIPKLSDLDIALWSSPGALPEMNVQ